MVQPQPDTEIKASLALYRTALMLNNMSVALLQRGFVDESLKTIRATLAVLQESFSRQYGTSSLVRRDDERDSYKSYHRAEHLIRRALSRFAKTSGKHLCVLPFEVEPVEDEVDFRAAAQYGPSSNMFFPVRFREGPSRDCKSVDTARRLAIVLYNQAIVQYLASTLEQVPRKRDNLLGSAVNSLRISQVTFARATDDDSSCTIDRILSILLETMTINLLSQVYTATNLHTKVEEARQNATILQARMNEHQYSFVLFVPGHTAAAA